MCVCFRRSDLLAFPPLTEDTQGLSSWSQFLLISTNEEKCRKYTQQGFGQIGMAVLKNCVTDFLPPREQCHTTIWETAIYSVQYSVLYTKKTKRKVKSVSSYRLGTILNKQINQSCGDRLLEILDIFLSVLVERGLTAVSYCFHSALQLLEWYYSLHAQWHKNDVIDETQLKLNMTSISTYLWILVTTPLLLESSASSSGCLFVGLPSNANAS